MKKIIGSLITAGCVFALITPSFATTSSQSTPGGVVTVTVANVPTTTTNFTYQPSPNVRLHIESNASNYAITAANDLTTTANGNEYGTTSAATGYAQRTKTVAPGTDIPAPSAADPSALPGTGWGWVGGAGS